MAEIGMKNADSMNKSFWGWYILSAGDVEAVGCSVRLSPLVANPYHADIIIPVALDAEDTTRRAHRVCERLGVPCDVSTVG